MRAPVFTGGIAAIVLAGGVAHAEPAPPSMPLLAPAEPTVEDADSSYRTTIGAVSGLGLSLMVIGFATDRELGHDIPEIVAGSGILTTFLAAPIAHGVHGETEHFLASFGLRIASTIAGGWLATRLPQCDRNAIIICDEALYGGIAGATVASVVDVLFIAKHRESLPSRHTIVPTVNASAGSASIGLGGSF